MGKPLFGQKKPTHLSESNLKIETIDLPFGTYFIILQKDSNNLVGKFLKTQ